MGSQGQLLELGSVPLRGLQIPLRRFINSHLKIAIPGKHNGRNLLCVPYLPYLRSAVSNHGILRPLKEL
jgi:hypothetical protein